MNPLPKICAGACLLLAHTETQGLNLAEAIHAKAVKIDVIWKSSEGLVSESRMHAVNLRMTIKNLTSSILNIQIPAGMMFTPADTSAQNMIVTENINFSVKPNDLYTRSTHGYCCEANDRAPNENERYELKKPASKNLQQLAVFIADNCLEGYGVQRAVWCISNGHELSDINVSDSQMTAQLISETGRLRGVDPKEIQRAIKIALKKTGNTFEKLVALIIPVERDRNIRIEIQDVNNRTVRLVEPNHRVYTGVYKKNIGLSSIEFGSGVFYIRVYSDEGYLTGQEVVLAK